MPMIELATIRIANAPWANCMVAATITNSTANIALTRVKTLSRTICQVVRPERSGSVLTFPSLTRSATWPAVRPCSSPVTIGGQSGECDEGRASLCVHVGSFQSGQGIRGGTCDEFLA